MVILLIHTPTTPEVLLVVTFYHAKKHSAGWLMFHLFQWGKDLE